MVVCIFFFLTSFTVTGELNYFSDVELNVLVEGLHDIRIFTDQSFAECWEECMARLSCKSVNYRPSAKLCLLKNITREDGTVKWSEGFVYRQKRDTRNTLSCGQNRCNVGETCDSATGQCEIRECLPLDNMPGVKVLGNVYSVGAKARLVCLPGYMPLGDEFAVSTKCNADGLWDKDLQCTPVTCQGLSTRGTETSGWYNSFDEGSHKIIRVYCDFSDPDTGYSYFAKESIKDITSLQKHFVQRDHVMLRHSQNGIQFNSKVSVLTQYRDRYNVSVYANSNPGFSSGLSGVFPYMFMGFVPTSFETRLNSTQGYECFGRSYNFTNCDSNTNNCFVVYSNLTNVRQCYGSSRTEEKVENGWKLCAIPVDFSRNAPPDVFLPHYAINMGGCGCASQNCEPIDGMAFGLPFSRYDYVTN